LQDIRIAGRPQQAADARTILAQRFDEAPAEESGCSGDNGVHEKNWLVPGVVSEW
jgi:hypothetical protein